MSKMITPEIARRACETIDGMIDDLSHQTSLCYAISASNPEKATGCLIQIMSNSLIAGILAEARMRYNREIDDSE
jgi:hypothetical protein